jgi:peptide/nickel transport system ATP-binding protein
MYKWDATTALSLIEKHKVLTGINLSIKQGESLGLVGESGSGKTTLGRTILRLITPDQGEILFKGKNIFTFSHKEAKEYRKKVQLVFQDPFSSLNPRLTIGKAIEEPIIANKLYDSKKQIRSKVDELLTLTGLSPSFYSRYPHELSGGQRQRVVIARALAVEPEFIICDEAVSALDVSVQAQILNLLNELKDTYNLTYLFISHDISVIKYFSDRIAVMKKGKIEEIGFSDEIYQSPKSEYTQKLFDAVFSI